MNRLGVVKSLRHYIFTYSGFPWYLSLVNEKRYGKKGHTLHRRTLMIFILRSRETIHVIYTDHMYLIRDELY